MLSVQVTCTDGDCGACASAVVQEGAMNVRPNQPLLAIVPQEADIQPFLDALKAHPRAIEGASRWMDELSLDPEV